MKTILIVEDVAICREPIAEVLTGRGYRVLTAEDGRKALEFLLSQPVDLVVLDVKMPVLDGHAVLNVISNTPKLRQIPVFILTNVSSRESIQRAASQGVKNYVLKTNFSLANLLSRIEKTIGAADAPAVTAEMVTDEK